MTEGGVQGGGKAGKRRKEREKGERKRKRERERKSERERERERKRGRQGGEREGQRERATESETKRLTNTGFICAEVMAFEDLKEFGTELEVKAKGKYRQEGETTNFIIIIFSFSSPELAVYLVCDF